MAKISENQKKIIKYSAFALVGAGVIYGGYLAFKHFQSKKVSTDSKDSGGGILDVVTNIVSPTCEKVDNEAIKTFFKSLTKDQIIQQQTNINKLLAIARTKGLKDVPKDLVIDGLKGNCTYGAALWLKTNSGTDVTTSTTATSPSAPVTYNIFDLF